MDSKARAVIEAAYMNGATVDEIAAAAEVDPIEAETYLRWWCDRGCPGAVTDSEVATG